MQRGVGNVTTKAEDTQNGFICQKKTVCQEDFDLTLKRNFLICEIQEKVIMRCSLIRLLKQEGQKMKIQLGILVMLISTVLATGYAEDVDKDNGIVEKEVMEAQKIWGEAIVAIGEAYTQKEDYKVLAEKVVDTLYGYDEGVVLFKPTKASEKQFRITKEEAVSYFVTGIVPEDRGFAIQPWSQVRFENAEIIILQMRIPEKKPKWSSHLAILRMRMASCVSICIIHHFRTNRCPDFD